MLQGGVTSMTISLNALANNAGRASAQVDNQGNGYNAALIYLLMRSGGSTPIANGTYDVFLLRRDGLPVVNVDGWGGTDTAFTALNATQIGSIRTTVNTNTSFQGVFDTALAGGALGPFWGIGIRNSSGAAMGTGSLVEFQYYTPD